MVTTAERLGVFAAANPPRPLGYVKMPQTTPYKPRIHQTSTICFA